MAKQVYNRVYTKEKWEKVNNFNKRLLDDFILELKCNKKKSGTITQYYNDIRIILIYILTENENKAISKLKRKHFRNFSLWCQEKGMSPARTNRLLSAVRSMLAYAGDDSDYEDDFETNEAQKVKGLKKEKVRDIMFVTDEEVEIIYKTLIERQKYQQAALLAISYDSAGRRNEIYQIEKEGLLNSNLTNIVLGKRGKKFPLALFDRSHEAIELWLTQRGKDDVKSLWKVGDKQASYESLYNWCISWRKILEEKTGVYKEFNNHSFRHSALENYNIGEHYYAKKLNKQFSIEELKLLAHHSSIDTTQGYLKNKDDELLLSAFGIVM